jgi:hypothetical protein
MGSVIDMVVSLPAGLDDAGDLPLARQAPEANTAHSKTPQKSPGTAAKVAAVVGPDLKLGLLFLLINQTFLRHEFS